jgi:hypothetical protein
VPRKPTHPTRKAPAPARTAEPPQPRGIVWFEPPEIPFSISPSLRQRLDERCRPGELRAVMQRLRYASFVDPKHKILYVETPKVASTSILLAFNRMHGRNVIRPFTGKLRETKPEMFVHSRKNAALLPLTAMSATLQREIFSSPDWLRFAFVRNPHTRVFSHWLNKIFLCEPSAEPIFALLGRAVPERLTSASDSISFDEFVRAVVSRIDLSVADQHFQTQEQLLQPDFFEYSFIGRIENLADDFARVQAHAKANGGTLPVPERQNPTLEDWRGFYDKELAAIVAEVYAVDFMRFGYETALDSRALSTARRKGGTPAIEARIDLYNEIYRRNRLFAQLYELELGKTSHRPRLKGE